ncbi:MAG: cyclomaltodextrinase N-terminal domain-containing protein, partial [Bacteroidota bacterium]
MRRISIVSVFLLIQILAQGQNTFTRVEPAFWWVGFSNPEVEVLFYHKDLNLSAYQPRVQSETVKLKRVTRTENPRYVF